MIKLYITLITTILIISSCQRDINKQEALRYNNTAILFTKTNIDSAIYYFNKAITVDSNYLIAHQNKINLLIATERYKEALEEINILSSKIENSEIFRIKGLLNDLTNNNTEARKNYLKTIEHIDEEVKRINDFLKYQKLFEKGTISLLLNKNKEGIELIEKYSQQANISKSRKDSIIQLQNNKEELVKKLIKP